MIHLLMVVYHLNIHKYLLIYKYFIIHLMYILFDRNNHSEYLLDLGLGDWSWFTINGNIFSPILISAI